MKKILLTAFFVLSFGASAFAYDMFSEQCNDSAGEREANRLMNICLNVLGEGAPCIESAPCSFITQAVTLQCRKTPVKERPADCIEFTGRQ